ncbi:lipoprotein [Oleiagrimonas sp. MCCC 1A03011]|uniref:LPS translocon maturation chaperone LptM n=1 Tax=Oleiagrimonas sp. MCCC 1A03011 TaxID=1926883 RepID=UPI000DD507DF|nr:lipoprotein [Oleiagrimonas sp. MCCC 1A03011]
MRSLLFMLASGTLCLLSACGNKGPLYRPHPPAAAVAPTAAATSVAPAAPASAAQPASAASTATDDD